MLGILREYQFSIESHGGVGIRKTCIMRTLTSVGLIQVRFTENVARIIGVYCNTS